MALVSAVLFGLAPAIRATRADLTAVMKATDAAGFGRRRRWGRALLVGGQVAVSVVLLVVATFMYRGFQQRLGSGPGYRTDHLLMMSFDPGLVRYTEPQAQQFFEQVAERARLDARRQIGRAGVVRADGMESRSSVTIVPEGFQFPAGKESATRSELDRGRALLRHDGADDSQRTRLPRDRFRRRAQRRRRQRAARRSTTGPARIRSASAFA